MITIVFCHPQTDSFCHRILNEITTVLTREGREYDVINLYGENYNPVLDSADLACWTTVNSSDPQSRQYAETLSKTTKIIFIFPIWWGSMPAMLKGFIDKSFIKGIVYDFTPEGSIMPCLSIDDTTLITTSEDGSELFGNYIMGCLAPMTLTPVGMNSAQWFNCDHISRKTDAERNNFITDVVAHIAR